MGNKTCSSFSPTGAEEVIPLDEGASTTRETAETVEDTACVQRITVAKRIELAWINALLAHMWPEIEDVMQQMIKDRVEPLLRSKLPDKLQGTHFSKVALGRKPPILDLIENYDLPHGTSGVHCSIVYDSDMVVEMSTGAFTFGMKDFSLHGEIVFLLRPYIDEHSGDGGTGGMTVYFINPPHLGIDFTGLAGVADLMGIKGLVRGAMDAALAEKLVLPNSITQLIGYKDFKVYPIVMGSPSPIGTLRVKTLRVKDMPKGDWSFFGGGKDDNYLKIQVGNLAWQARVTNMGDTQEFMIFDPEQLLMIDLWDEDHFSDDDHLGTTQPMHLYQAVRMSGQPIQLHNPGSNKKAGSVELQIEYFDGQLQTIGKSGSIIMIQIRELHVRDLKESKLMVEARFGKKVETSPVGKVLRNIQQENAIHSAMRDVRDRLKRHGMKQADIDKITKEETLTVNEVKTRIALNAYMLFSVDADHAFDGEIELVLWDRRNTTDKKAVKDLKNHAKDEELGRAKIQLSSLKSAMTLTVQENNFRFVPKNNKTPQDAYEAELTVSICGLEPGEPPVVNAVDCAVSSRTLLANASRTGTGFFGALRNR